MRIGILSRDCDAGPQPTFWEALACAVRAPTIEDGFKAVIVALAREDSPFPPLMRAEGREAVVGWEGHPDTFRTFGLRPQGGKNVGPKMFITIDKADFPATAFARAAAWARELGAEVCLRDMEGWDAYEDPGEPFDADYLREVMGRDD